MMSAVAVAAGALAILVVLILGAVARRPVRRVPTADGDRAPPRPAAPRRTAVRLAVALLVGVAVAAAGALPVVATAGAVLVVQRRRRRATTAARRQAVEATMPDAVELLVLCMHAGCSPTQAVVTVAARAPPAVRPAFAEVELRLHRGQTLAAALGALGAADRRLGAAVGRAIAAADRDGLPLAPILDRLVADARAERRRVGEAEARRLPVRLTFPLVLCTLPSFVLLTIAPAVLGALSTLRASTP